MAWEVRIVSSVAAFHQTDLLKFYLGSLHSRNCVIVLQAKLKYMEKLCDKNNRISLKHQEMKKQWSWQKSRMMILETIITVDTDKQNTKIWVESCNLL